MGERPFLNGAEGFRWKICAYFSMNSSNSKSNKRHASSTSNAFSIWVRDKNEWLSLNREVGWQECRERRRRKGPRWVTSRKSTFCLQTIFEVPPERAKSRSGQSIQSMLWWENRKMGNGQSSPPFPQQRRKRGEERISRILDAHQAIFEESLEDLQHAKI